MRIKAPDFLGRGGKRVRRRGDTVHLSAKGSPPPYLAAGEGLPPSLASWQTACGCKGAQGGGWRDGKPILSLFLHRGCPVITSSSSGTSPNPQLGSERAHSSAKAQFSRRPELKPGGSHASCYGLTNNCIDHVIEQISFVSINSMSTVFFFVLFCVKAGRLGIAVTAS